MNINKAKFRLSTYSADLIWKKYHLNNFFYDFFYNCDRFVVKIDLPAIEYARKNYARNYRTSKKME